MLHGTFSVARDPAAALDPTPAFRNGRGLRVDSLLVIPDEVIVYADAFDRRTAPRAATNS